MILVSVLMVGAGLGLLVIGGECLLRGAVGLARALGVSTLLIGLTVVACATSMPELVVTVSAGLAGRPDLAVGNVIGSNIANILLILGAAGLVCSINPPRNCCWRDGLAMLGAALVFVVLAAVTPLTWPHGLVLIVLLVGYIYRSYRIDRDRPSGDVSTEAAEAIASAPRSGWAMLGLIVAGSAGLVVGSNLLIDGAVDIARVAGVSDAVIGLTLVAIGTSLPELATAVVAAVRRAPEVALGNVVGSNIFNVLGIMGVLAMTTPVAINDELLAFDVWVMLGASLVLMLLLATRSAIGGRVGLLFLVIYLLFVGAQFQFSRAVGPILASG